MSLQSSYNLGVADMCQCGCRGWCTVFPLILRLAIDLLACVMGGYNSVPEGLKSIIQNTVCSELLFVLAVIEMRADWPAWNEIAGVRSWAHATFPCPKCTLPLAMMITADKIGEISASNWPWSLYRHLNYMEDVQRSTIAT
jgi:hypothetical protein